MMSHWNPWLVLLTSTLLIAGCGGEEKTGSTVTVEGNASDSQEPTAVYQNAKQQGLQVVPGWGLSYTANPTLEQIPQWPAKGTANGRPFEAKTILISPLFGNWQFQLHDRTFDAVAGSAAAKAQPGNKDMQTIYVNLQAEPRVGQVINRPLEYGGGYFQIKRSADEESTWSWNTSLAYVIEFTNWQRAPYDEARGGYQQGGTASGRLYISFQGKEDGSMGDIGSSFVAGDFKDIPIVYYGRPDGDD